MDTPDSRRTARKTSTQALRIIVLGYMVRGPLGGMVWSNLQYLLGLARLGHDVYFLEDSDDYPSCYDPVRSVIDVDPGYGLAFVQEVLTRLGLGERWAYHDAHAGRWHGPCAGRVPALCASADLLFNLCGINPMRPWLAQVPCRVFVDEDPVFTQIRHLTDPAARALAVQHTAFFSFAENIGGPGCTVPDDGLPWRPTRQPVVLEAVQATPGPRAGSFTTVMQWESYRARDFGGVRYGMKSDSFMPYLDLPRRAQGPFELALGSAVAPRALLAENGWVVVNPLVPTRDPWTYLGYLQRSKAEFSVVKHGYAVSRSGWFSERSACYLASGRPVVLQEAGFSDRLRVGDGLLAFSTPAEAVAAVEDVNNRYRHHCRAARALAEECFDSRRLLPGLIEQAMTDTEVQPDRAASGSQPLTDARA